MFMIDNMCWHSEANFLIHIFFYSIQAKYVILFNLQTFQILLNSVSDFMSLLPLHV